MGTEATEQQTAESSPASPAEAGNLDQRAAALIEQLNSEARAVEPEVTTEEQPAPATAAPPADKPDPVAARKARLAEVERLRQEERAKVAASRARAPKQAAMPPAAAPPAPQGPVITDVDSFFRIAEQMQISPQKVADWLQKQQNPAALAAHVAEEKLTPLQQELRKTQERIEAFERAQAEKEARQHQAAQLHQVRQALAAHTQAVAAEAPLAVRLLTKSPDRYFALADTVAESLPDGFTAQDIVDQIEEQLSDFGQLYAEPPSPTSTTKRTKEPAAAKAHVGNRMAAERATVSEDEEVPADLESRADRLKARLRAAG